jgi:hypothetical protein
MLLLVIAVLGAMAIFVGLWSASLYTFVHWALGHAPGWKPLVVGCLAVLITGQYVLGVFPTFDGSSLQDMRDKTATRTWTMHFWASAIGYGDVRTQCTLNKYTTDAFASAMDRVPKLGAVGNRDGCWISSPDLPIGIGYKGCYFFDLLSGANFESYTDRCAGPRGDRTFVDRTKRLIMFEQYMAD